MNDNIKLSVAAFFDPDTQEFGAEITLSGVRSAEHVDFILQAFIQTFISLGSPPCRTTAH